MISVQTVVDRMTSVLDAEGSDRYLFDQDFKPAINSAIDWLVIVFNAAFADKKLSEEDLRDLVKMTIWQTNSFSRVYLDEGALGYEVWSVLGVHPKPVVTPVTTPPTLAPNTATSSFKSDLSYVSSINSAKRLNLEEWNMNSKNVFSAGNITLTGALQSYSYLGHVNYTSTGYAPGGEEIEVRPAIPGEFVGISLLKNPTKVSVVTDSIEFPNTLLDVLFQRALNFIAYKQGDQTNLYNVTATDVQTLVNLMV